MPTYEFVCKACKEKFNISIPFTESLGAKIGCPKCNSTKTKRVWLAPAVIYKGRGFYKKDNL